MDDITMNCVYHPQARTGLRCNQCDQPVCAKCVVRTPVGYRCKGCVKSQQKVFETARLSDYILVPMIVMTLAGVGSLFSMISPVLTTIATPMAVGLMAEAAQRVMGRRWSRHLRGLVAAAFVVGCLPMACSQLATPFDLWRAAGFLLYMGVGIYTLRAR